MEQKPAGENPGDAQQQPEIILSPAPSGARQGAPGQHESSLSQLWHC